MKLPIVILGGGPSGLGIAWGLAEAGYRNITLVEKGERLGGLSGSIHLDDLVVDFGPHRFSPEYPELVSKLKELLKEQFLEVSNEHAVIFRDRTYRYPPQIGDFLNFDSMAFSAQVLGSYFLRRLTSRKTDSTFPSQIRRNFGPKLYEAVVDPLVRKVWGDPEMIDPSFSEIRFSVPTFTQWGLRWLNERQHSRDKIFFYPQEGFQQIWDRLKVELAGLGVRFLFKSVVEKIERTENKIQKVVVRTPHGSERLSCDWLLSTIPSENLLPLLADDFSDELKPSEKLNRGMILIVFKVRRERSLPARVVIFPEAKYVFNRLSEQNQFSRSMVPKGFSAIQADILADTDSALWKEPDATIEALVTQQVLSLGFFTAQELEKSYVVRVPLAYPLPTRSREERQRKMNGWFAQFENLICTGRFASSDYNNSHSALRKGFLAAKHVASDLKPADWYANADTLRQVPIRD